MHWNARAREVGAEGGRDSAHGVEAPKGPQLQRLVEAVLAVAPREALYRGHRRNAEAASGTGVDHVRAVAVRMHHVRPDSPADLDHRSPLAEVSPRPNAHRDNIDAGRDEGR